MILPDTKSSVRWETKDRPALEAAFKAAGVDYTIQNAEGSADTMATIADGMIADGVTVLAIVNLDSDSGASIQQKAATQGVKTIDYDRLTLGGSADVYVSFDNTVVGELQGQGSWTASAASRECGVPQRFSDRQQRDPVQRRGAFGDRRDADHHGRRRAGGAGLGHTMRP